MERIWFAVEGGKGAGSKTPAGPFPWAQQQPVPRALVGPFLTAISEACSD